MPGSRHILLIHDTQWTANTASLRCLQDHAISLAQKTDKGMVQECIKDIKHQNDGQDRCVSSTDIMLSSHVSFHKNVHHWHDSSAIKYVHAEGMNLSTQIRLALVMICDSNVTCLPAACTHVACLHCPISTSMLQNKPL